MICTSFYKLEIMGRSILLGIVLFVGIVANAQNNYQVSGKIGGIAEETVWLVTGENGKQDTLNSARVKNGFFMFEGKVDRPIAVHIVSTDRVIPFILENANIMINANQSGVLIQGGEQQEIFNQFSRNNMKLLQTQDQILQEFLQAEQAGNKKQMQALTTQFEMVVADARKEEEKLLMQYADSYVAAYVVASGMYQLELDVLKARYALLGKNARATAPGRSVELLIEKWESLAEGNKAPDFTVSTLQGDSLTLYSIKAKLKLVHFWDASDAICRQDNVNLLKLYQHFHLKGFEIISISGGENEQVWRNAINTDGMFWRNGIDYDLRVFHLYGVRTLPYTVLLDEEDRIVAKNLNAKELQKEINELLKKKK